MAYEVQSEESVPVPEPFVASLLFPEESTTFWPELVTWAELIL